MNGTHLLEYKHRIPLDRVDTFSLSGKVRVNAIAYIPNSVSTTCLDIFLYCDSIIKKRKHTFEGF